eukprot:NODE_165_length_16345_cov_0.329743.p1 type:complete len:1531 gc:universal NODE_165_length_16345_cov_0.329743:14888-10296(-)
MLLLFLACFAGVLKDNIIVQTIFDGLNWPTRTRFAPDGRVFVTTKAGMIYVYPDINTNTPKLVADIRNHVYSVQDHALSGIAIDNNFPSSPYIYVYFSADADKGDYRGIPKYNSNCGPTRCLTYRRLARITYDGIKMTKFDIIYEGGCTISYSHVNGGLEMLSDGSLIFTTGDLAFYEMMDYGQQDFCPKLDPNDPDNPFKQGAFRSQYMNSVGGKLSHVTVDDLKNSLAASVNPKLSATQRQAAMMVTPVYLVRGLRNPWGLSYDRNTEMIAVPIVGYDTYEWINVFKAPTNPEYDPNAPIPNSGWPCYEGGWSADGYVNFEKQQYLNFARPYTCANVLANMQQPDLWTKHGEQYGDVQLRNQGQSSIVAAIVYNYVGTPKYPQSYYNSLFYTDHSWGYMWTVPPNLYGSTYQKTTNRQSRSNAIGLIDQFNMVDLKVGPDGFIYITRIEPGAVQRLVSTTFPLPPIVNFVLDKSHGALPLTVTFDASNAKDVLGNKLVYEWDILGNNQFVGGNSVIKHTYTVKQMLVIRVRVTAGTQSTIKQLNIAPGYYTTSTITYSIAASDGSISTRTEWAVGDLLRLSAVVVDESNNVVSDAFITISSSLYHCYPAPCTLVNNVQSSDCHEHKINEFNGHSCQTNMPDHEYPSRAKVTTSTVHPVSGLIDVQVASVYPLKYPLNIRSNMANINIYGLSGPLCTTPLCTHYYIANGGVTLTAPQLQEAASGVSQVLQFVKWECNQKLYNIDRQPISLSTNTLEFSLLQDDVILTAVYSVVVVNTGTTNVNNNAISGLYALPSLNTITYSWNSNDLPINTWFVVRYNTIPKVNTNPAFTYRVIGSPLRSYTFNSLDYCTIISASIAVLDGTGGSLALGPFTNAYESRSSCHRTSNAPNIKCPVDCQPIAIQIHDFKNGFANNLNGDSQAVNGDQSIQNNWYSYNDRNGLWYTWLANGNVCFDASLFTTIEFDVILPANGNFGVRFDMKDGNCNYDAPSSDTVMINDFSTVANGVQHVAIPISNLKIGNRLLQVKALVFSNFNQQNIPFRWSNVQLTRKCTNVANQCDTLMINEFESGLTGKNSIGLPYTDNGNSLVYFVDYNSLLTLIPDPTVQSEFKTNLGCLEVNWDYLVLDMILPVNGNVMVYLQLMDEECRADQMVGFKSTQYMSGNRIVIPLNRGDRVGSISISTYNPMDRRSQFKIKSILMTTCQDYSLNSVDTVSSSLIIMEWGNDLLFNLYLSTISTYSGPSSFGAGGVVCNNVIIDNVGYMQLRVINRVYGRYTTTININVNEYEYLEITYKGESFTVGITSNGEKHGFNSNDFTIPLINAFKLIKIPLVYVPGPRMHSKIEFDGFSGNEYLFDKMEYTNNGDCVNEIVDDFNNPSRFGKLVNLLGYGITSTVQQLKLTTMSRLYINSNGSGLVRYSLGLDGCALISRNSALIMHVNGNGRFAILVGDGVSSYKTTVTVDGNSELVEIKTENMKCNNNGGEWGIEIRELDAGEYYIEKMEFSNCNRIKKRQVNVDYIIDYSNEGFIQV